MFYVIVYTSHNGIEFKRGGAGAEGGMAYVNAKLGNNFLFSKRIGIFYWAYWAYWAYGLMGWKVAARIFHSLSGKSQGKTHRISQNYKD